MLFLDFIYVLKWWFVFFTVGLFFFPFCSKLFHEFKDKGYIFSKTIGIMVVSYIIFVLGAIHILPFTYINSLLVLLLTGSLFFILGLRKNKDLLSNIPLLMLEEFLFLLSLLFWSFIKGHQPDIHGLEKFMDYGFINSILRSTYFPPKDMWFTPFSINYYYFGHLTTAVLTKISNIPSTITFNLMLSSLFALTFTSCFSIGINLFFDSKQKWRAFYCGIITAILTTFAGNLHALYIFFQPYLPNNPVPFWNLPLALSTIPNSYWYPNATRFIYNTIHEFPIYSFVVSDLHGHVLDIPFVLLTIAFLFSLLKKHFTNKEKFYLYKKQIEIGFPLHTILATSFLLSIMYITNAWDGIIYTTLTFFIFLFLFLKDSDFFAIQWANLTKFFITFVLLGVFFFLFSLPFSAFFSPFVSGIGLLCAPSFLTSMQRLGPFIFEENHCQTSPFWQLFILYGFFYFWFFSYIIFFLKKLKSEITSSSIFILLLVLLSTILIIVPEFIYAKDIYPAHYRANTMFKLVYQSFIMLSIASGFIITKFAAVIKPLPFAKIAIFKKFLVSYYIFIGCFLIFVVLIYPYYAVKSYFENLKTYYGLDGIKYLQKIYPSDYEAIGWIEKNIKNQPIILEAQGDSYTDFARISANTGLPTILGWTVHEWLWRKTYSIPAPRIADITILYESDNFDKVKKLITRYNVAYVFVGDLERQKYKNLNENNFTKLGVIVFNQGATKIYKIK